MRESWFLVVLICHKLISFIESKWVVVEKEREEVACAKQARELGALQGRLARRPVVMPEQVQRLLEGLGAIHHELQIDM